MDLIDATAAALPQSAGIGLVVGSALILATALVLVRGVRAPSAAVLATLVLVWQPLNQSVEGQVLWTVSATHGITTADLLALPALTLIARHLLGRRRHPVVRPA